MPVPVPAVASCSYRSFQASPSPSGPSPSPSPPVPHERLRCRAGLPTSDPPAARFLPRPPGGPGGGTSALPGCPAAVRLDRSEPGHGKHSSRRRRGDSGRRPRPIARPAAAASGIGPANLCCCQRSPSVRLQRRKQSLGSLLCGVGRRVAYPLLSQFPVGPALFKSYDESRLDRPRPRCALRAMLRKCWDAAALDFRRANPAPRNDQLTLRFTGRR